MVQLEPHIWRESYYTCLDVRPRNRSFILSLCLRTIPPIELLLEKNTETILAHELLSLQIYFRELPDGFDTKKLLMSLPAGWEYQVFNPRITATFIWFIRNDGDRVFLNQRNKYVLEWKCLIERRANNKQEILGVMHHPSDHTAHKNHPLSSSTAHNTGDSLHEISKYFSWSSGRSIQLAKYQKVVL